MSTVNEKGLKIVLPRLGEDSQWETIHKEYTAKNRLRWKYLAMLSLQINAGWSLEHIGFAFGHPKGHIVRCLDKVKAELRERFQYADEYLDTEQPENKSTPQNKNSKWNTEPVSRPVET